VKNWLYRSGMSILHALLFVIVFVYTGAGNVVAFLNQRAFHPFASLAQRATGWSKWWLSLLFHGLFLVPFTFGKSGLFGLVFVPLWYFGSFFDCVRYTWRRAQEDTPDPGGVLPSQHREMLVHQASMVTLLLMGAFPCIPFSAPFLVAAAIRFVAFSCATAPWMDPDERVLIRRLLPASPEPA